ncbi:type IV pilin [Haloferax namakaokahaiae]|uniref:Type IV pilin n=1 Tax=Haloferax namakaokahaiae TaxID=1748331 RepID=A0ABD5ZHQ6_9EURY
MIRNFSSATRGVTPVVGVVVLVGIVVVLASVVGTAALGMAASTPSPSQPTALSLDVNGQSISLTNEAGPALDVHMLRLTISVDGTPIRFQPAVPFFSARGFAPGPTGPFNSASDSTWSVGETASLELAGTNSPRIESGSEVVVRVYRGEMRIASLRAIAG